MQWLREVYEAFGLYGDKAAFLLEVVWIELPN